MHFLLKDHLGYTTYVRCILPYCESISQHHINERSRWDMGHIGTKDHGVQWDNWGTLGQVSLCAPQCPNVQCYNIIVIGYHHQKQPFWIILGK